MKPKLLFIIHFPPPVHGSSTVGLYIKESQAINNNYSCKFINLNTSSSINNIGSFRFEKIIKYFIIVFKLVIELVFNKPKLCYIAMTVKGVAFFKDSLLIILVKLFRVKIVHHFHNKGIDNKQSKFIYNLFYNLVFKDTYAILLSQYLYYDIKKYFPTEAIFYCPNGISDTENNHSNEKISNDVVKILFISNLIKSKGIYILLESCKKLKQHLYQFSCDIIGNEGDISKEDVNKKIFDLGLYPEVKYLGPKFGMEKEMVLRNSDIFVLPTYEDCFPLVLLEAMQHQLPIISTFEGAIADIVDIEKTGFLVEKRNIEELTSKIEILILNENLRKEMGYNAFIKYKSNFTSKVFENNLLKIINSVMTI